MPIILWIKKLYFKNKYLLESAIIITVFFALTFVFMLYIYHGTQRSLVDTIYFTTMIMTTVGFGDITPSTDVEKMMIVAFMLIGITSLGYVVGFIANKVSVISNLKLRGMRKMKKSVGLLIIGYPSEQKVREIVSHIRHDEREQENIVCLNNVLEERPQWMVKENVTFIKGIGSDKFALLKANVSTVDTCLILANETDNYATDDYTSSAATVFLKLKKDSAKLLVEVVRSDNILFEDYDREIVTTFRVDNAEVISQEILDPGAFQLKNATFSTKTSGTQYNIDFSPTEDVEWSKVACSFIMNGVIPEGFKLSNNNNFNLLPKPTDMFEKGLSYSIKYRGSVRLDEFKLS